MPLIRPVVLVYQEFAAETVTAVTPDLQTLIIGPGYHIQDYPADKASIPLTSAYGTLEAAPADAATPTGPDAIVTTDLPNNVVGALVDPDSVKVYFDQARVVIGSRLNSVTTTLNSNSVTFAPVTGVKAFKNLATLGDGKLDTVVQAKSVGTAGNVIQVALVQDGTTPTTMVEAGNTVTFHFKNADAACTVASVEALIAGSTLIEIKTPGTGATVLITATAFALTNLAGGVVPVAATTFLSGAEKVLAGDRILITDGAAKTIVRTVQSIPSDTELLLTADVTADGGYAAGASQKWRIERKLVDKLIDSSFVSLVGNALHIAGGVTLSANSADKVVSYAQVYVAYRSLRQDLQDVIEIQSTAEILAKLGRIDARNPLAANVFVAKQNTTTRVLCYGVDTNDLVGHTKVRDNINSRDDVYALIPLTTDLAIINMWKTDNVGLALPDEVKGRPQRFRVVIGSGTLPTTKTMFEASATATALADTGTAPTGVRTLLLTGLNLLTSGVIPGDKVTITVDANATTRVGTYTVASVIDATHLEVVEVVPGTTGDSANATLSIKNSDLTVTRVASGAVAPVVSTVLNDLFLILRDPAGTFVTSGVIPGDTIRIPRDPNSGTFTTYDTLIVASVISENRLKIVNNGNDTATVMNELPHGVKRGGGALVTQGSINYTIVRNLSKSGQVSALVATAQSLSSRRAIMVWPDLVDVAGVAGGTAQPGYYLASAVGGMTSGLPSQQGFTFLGIAGVSQIYHSSNYFSDPQLTDLMQGGWYVFAQQTPSSIPYTIHQLTTDPATLQSGEYSIVKNYDYVAMSLVAVLTAFLGKYNVTPETLSFIRTAINDQLTTLRLRTLSRIGAPLTDGNIVSLAQSPLSADRVISKINLVLPAPLNVIELHLVG